LVRRGIRTKMILLNPRQFIRPRYIDGLTPRRPLQPQSQGNAGPSQCLSRSVVVTGVQGNGFRSKPLQLLLEHRAPAWGHMKFDFAFQHGGPDLSRKWESGQYSGLLAACSLEQHLAATGNDDFCQNDDGEDQ